MKDVTNGTLGSGDFMEQAADHPFCLAGIDKNDWYIAKFGAERVKMMHERLSQIGREAGINFKYVRYYILFH